MIYSCGYWKDATNLDEAQEAKLDLICRKIGLEQGMRMLDIGSGWGGFLRFAAERYGVEGVGITISQRAGGLCRCASRRPADRNPADGLHGARAAQFDRVISIGMFEHVGYKNYRAYFEKARTLLKPDGLFLLHTIGGN